MADLGKQYLKLKEEISLETDSVFSSAQFIKGEKVEELEKELASYLGVKHVITCGNGTDALQLALMALNLTIGDEVICPSFSFISSAEAVALLGYRPVFVDVSYDDFNITMENIKDAITVKTKAIIPVHLFGQAADMEKIMNLANQYNLFVIEDNAQSFGADFTFSQKNESKKLGTIGNIGCTSFFPTKNLACYGDGGAVFTDDDSLAEKIRMRANHGMKKKYFSEIIGINSRLDTLQAAVLKVKLSHLEECLSKRREVASRYDELLKDVSEIILPQRKPSATHTFNQYTLKIKDNKRNELKTYLENKGIASQIYYPYPLHSQESLSVLSRKVGEMAVTEQLCREVLSLPMHTELEDGQIKYITDSIKQFFVDNN